MDRTQLFSNDYGNIVSRELFFFKKYSIIYARIEYNRHGKMNYTMGDIYLQTFEINTLSVSAESCKIESKLMSRFQLVFLNLTILIAHTRED